ncbi:potassium channel family protein [Chitinivibrio alkaliphilus]|uniref:K+ transport system, NAD-binding component n=1 Tax=Chitinivibrio alkaliphilus ACht1 TaxID=1313304 RepID=U7D5M6_9BACT|nr:TrkA family potassium uptake protein [Chitinivibrio alkaliphilus]ERP31273.1 K+ transport system, NAD-binding component [Chitinivibrio alkaliphilus ACht1]
MNQQILIIGLGQFGMSLAKSLSEKGAEVIAIDRKKILVEEASAFVTEALVMDATNEHQLAQISPKSRDAVVCAIGDEGREASIMCTAILKQMGTSCIIARSNDTMHMRILKSIGGNQIQIINPEKEFGVRFATRLLYKDFIADTSISDDLHLTEVKIQPSIAGKSLIELELPKRFGIIVAAIRRSNTGKTETVVPEEALRQDDALIIVSRESAIHRFMKEVE